MLRVLQAALILGTYPQHFEPRLTVAFAHYAGTEKVTVEQVAPTDSLTLAGPIPYLILDSVNAVKKVLEKQHVFSQEKLGCFLEATREVVCNALMHRDYSPLGRGSLVQVNLFADRLEVVSPGGLYGAVTSDSMGDESISATRNKTLAALLETTPYPAGGLVTTNSGESFGSIKRQLVLAGLPAPEIVDKPSYFSVTLRFENQVAVASAKTAPKDSNYGLYIKSIEQEKPEVQYLRGSMLAVYKVVYERGCARTSDVVELSGMPRSTVSYAVKRLVSDGLIEVIGEDVSRNSPQRLYRVV